MRHPLTVFAVISATFLTAHTPLVLRSQNYTQEQVDQELRNKNYYEARKAAIEAENAYDAARDKRTTDALTAIGQIGKDAPTGAFTANALASVPPEALQLGYRSLHVEIEVLAKELAKLEGSALFVGSGFNPTPVSLEDYRQFKSGSEIVFSTADGVRAMMENTPDLESVDAQLRAILAQKFAVDLKIPSVMKPQLALAGVLNVAALVPAAVKGVASLFQTDVTVSTGDLGVSPDAGGVLLMGALSRESKVCYVSRDALLQMWANTTPAQPPADSLKLWTDEMKSTAQSRLLSIAAINRILAQATADIEARLTVLKKSAEAKPAPPNLGDLNIEIEILSKWKTEIAAASQTSSAFLGIYAAKDTGPAIVSKVAFQERISPTFAGSTIAFFQVAANIDAAKGAIEVEKGWFGVARRRLASTVVVRYQVTDQHGKIIVAGLRYAGVMQKIEKSKDLVVFAPESGGFPSQ